MRLDIHTWIFDKDIYFDNNDVIDLKLMYRQFIDEKTKAKLHEYYMFYRKNYDKEKLYFHPDLESQDKNRVNIKMVDQMRQQKSGMTLYS